MSTALQDVQIPCADCGDGFIFSIPEQLFYAERGLAQPERCAGCRAKRRSERHGEAMRAAVATGTEQRETGFGNYGGAPGTNRKNARPGSRMFSVVCSACGRPTEVPFEPRGGRPVYCRECFNARRGR